MLLCLPLPMFYFFSPLELFEAILEKWSSLIPAQYIVVFEVSFCLCDPLARLDSGKCSQPCHHLTEISWYS